MFRLDCSGEGMKLTSEHNGTCAALISKVKLGVRSAEVE